MGLRDRLRVVAPFLNAVGVCSASGARVCGSSPSPPPRTNRRQVKLECKHVDYCVGPRDPEREIKIMRDVSCSFYPGEMVALMGPSGAGKTTFMTTRASTRQLLFVVKGGHILT